jgi:hypothetical protein
MAGKQKQLHEKKAILNEIQQTNKFTNKDQQLPL